ncbi:class I SAM-dependent methyltransferase [Bacteroidaceae bacterium HV4-6-C5C]|jgi:hypothetical protein|nr:class I SAM-dependent methyltransferase [Bacteroidaceae bacterium HV4-6-C5C]
MKDFWNERYSQAEYIYGEDPNAFFKESIDKLNPGRILLPAEGEGRNAVYAASRGWQVEAFDQSAQGQVKATQLADKAGVSISYTLSEGIHPDYSLESFDVIAFIYTHTAPDIRTTFHSDLLPYLKSGGKVILEGFSKGHYQHQQSNPHAGGPPEKDMLYSLEEIPLLFPNLGIILLSEVEITLSEGVAHKGEASVIRYIGEKR